MGGRIYDPLTGRFMQADPIVQAPEDSQSLNRYSYVLNNPLSYTDPTGYECNNERTGAPNRDCVYGMDNNEEHSDSNGNTDTSGGSDNRDVNSANRGDSPRNSADRASGETPEEGEDGWGFWDGVQLTLDGAGMVPAFGNIADLANAAISALRGDKAGAALSMAAAVPVAGLAVGAGKLGKKVADGVTSGKLQPLKKTADKLAGGKAGDSNALVPKKADGPDFVVTKDGTAVPVSQSQMRKGFDDAGFHSSTSKITDETAVTHTVPTSRGSINVRTMEGGANHPRRAVFSTPGQPRSPRTPDGGTPRGTKQQQRAASHLEQSQ